MREKEFLKSCHMQQKYAYILYMVAREASLCEDFSDLTSPTSNHYI